MANETIKMRAPKGGTGCSFRGEEYKADAKGVVEVPPEAAPELLHHGYTPIGADAEAAAQGDAK